MPVWKLPHLWLRDISGSLHGQYLDGAVVRNVLCCVGVALHDVVRQAEFCPALARQKKTAAVLASCRLHLVIGDSAEDKTAVIGNVELQLGTGRIEAKLALRRLP
jgi:hypothetical protein